MSTLPEPLASRQPKGPEQIAQALAVPFDPAEIKFKPAVGSGSRALALAYVDARAIQDRLDAVVGPAGWSDEYAVLSDGSVVCRLSLRCGEDWITKTDCGSPSEQKDEHDRMKAAFSDALKRAAVKWGIGRYLYRLPSTWADYDAQRKQILKPPVLPAWALPASGGKNGGGPAPEANGSRISEAQERELAALLRQMGTNVAKFLEYFRVRALAQLPAAEYQRAVALLRAKAPAKGA